MSEKDGRNLLKNRNRAYAAEYKATHPCVDCGNTDPRVLDFDHRNRAEKLYSISFMLVRCFSIEMLKAEIAKCDVRCANCHRIKTAEQMDRYPLEEWETE